MWSFGRWICIALLFSVFEWLELSYLMIEWGSHGFTLHASVLYLLVTEHMILGMFVTQATT